MYILRTVIILFFIQVILFQPNKTKAVVLPQAIISRGYVCEVSSSPESILTQLQDPLNQVWHSYVSGVVMIT